MFKIIKNIKFLTVIAIFLIACVQKKAENTETNPTNSMALMPIKVIVFADKTGSIEENGIPKLAAEDLKIILDRISQTGGELSVALISDNSVKHNATIKIAARVQMREQKRGESSDDYSKNVIQPALAAKKNREKDNERIQNFMQQVNSFLNYDKLSPSTDICNAVEFANLYLSEPTQFKELKKVAVMITDGNETNTKKTNCNNSLCCGLVVVNRKNFVGVLQNYNPTQFTSIESAFEYISKQ